jgi:hypothetical protein
MIMNLITAADVVDVILDELVTLKVLPVKRYEDMSTEDRARLVDLLVTRYGDTPYGQKQVDEERRRFSKAMQQEKK